MIGIIFLLAGAGLAMLVFKLTVDADWHWGPALSVAAIPFAFTFFLGIFGLIIAVLFTTAMWRAVD